MSGNYFEQKQYAKRDAKAMGAVYTRHVLAMTAEGLFSKSDIAAELAWRDVKITELEQQLADAREMLDDTNEALAIEVNAREEAEAKLTERDKLLDECEKGFDAVRSLMADSGGVYGLHLNGDPAPWSELETGGRFEEWLINFDIASTKLRDRKNG